LFLNFIKNLTVKELNYDESIVNMKTLKLFIINNTILFSKFENQIKNKNFLLLFK